MDYSNAGVNICIEHSLLVVRQKLAQSYIFNLLIGVSTLMHFFTHSESMSQQKNGSYMNRKIF